MEQTVDAKSDEYELMGLDRGCNYQICGRYKLLENMVWSHSSSIMSMATKEWEAEWYGKLSFVFSSITSI